MPIRFRCVYCDKLLGIATRKAGTVVNCPQCGQPLIVPSPEPQAAPAVASVAAQPSAPAAPAVGGFFEQDDFDVVLAGDATVQAPPQAAPPPLRQQPVRTAPAPLPRQSFAVEQSLPTPSFRAPLPIPAPAQPSGFMLTPIKLIIALVGVLFLMGLAFGGGILVGRMLG